MSLWQVDGFSGQLNIHPLRATLDLPRAHAGLGDVCLFGRPCRAMRLLAVDLPFLTPTSQPEPSPELHVRGAAVAASYPESTGWPVQVDLLWRAFSAGRSDPFLGAIELVLSVRTPHGESRPALTATSVLPGGEVLRLGDPASVHFERLELSEEGVLAMEPGVGSGCLVFRIPDADVSYAEMIHPADFHDDQLAQHAGPDRTLRLCHRLFPDPLEKGVILRARIRGGFFARGGDLERVAADYAAFAAAEPPLGSS